eukprot:CAMPEP_0194483194 /NCGR_PEP_ID=MMETSP0253-20130528/4887_1 /TAXON_ID=2966 /ORGANISM="Noctiluca scintillans" /LENGTH=266 /DNA_ID=CAMNT_0039322833 /DNA_START=11 /DNA_END=811 /DNA_ORIENTATION=+
MTALGVRKSGLKRGAFLQKPKANGRVSAKTSSPNPAHQVPSEFKGISALVINLDSRPDRWAKVQRSFAKSAPWLCLQRLSACNGKMTPPANGDVTQKWSTQRLADIFSWYTSKTIPMSPGERGCCMSHVEAWKVVAKRKRPMLVIEDDAVALHTFTRVLSTALKEAPKSTGAIFLSSKDRGTVKRAGDVLMEPFYVWTTVGYLIWPAAARKLLSLRPLDMPVDNFMAWHIKEGDVTAFSVKPAALRQANTWNVGSDVPHSDDVAHV